MRKSMASCFSRNRNEKLVSRCQTYRPHFPAPYPSWAAFRQPPSLPQNGKVSCGLCVQDDQLTEGEFGYCVKRPVSSGLLVHHRWLRGSAFENE
jgi:hypothetical protein